MDKLLINKISLLVITLLLVIPLLAVVSAESQIQTLGTFKQGTKVTLLQGCTNSTYSNVSTISLPNSTLLLNSERSMTKTGDRYNYTLSSTNTLPLGEYIVSGQCDENGVRTGWIYNLFITPSGTSNNLGFYIIIIGIIYIIAFFGFFGKNVWVAVFGGMALMILGGYTLLNGIDVFRNTMTEVFSLITVGLGAIFALTATLELIADNIQ